VAWALRFTALKILKIKINIINGQQNSLEGFSPCIFISNHQHMLDVCICGAIVPQKTFAMGKKSILLLPFFGQVFWLAGNALINRSKRDQAIRTMDDATNKLTRENMATWIMPEGTRNHGKGLLPFKKGAFHSAIKAQVPLIPVCISSYESINLNKLFPGEVTIKVMPAIKTKGLTATDVNRLKNEAFSSIKKGLQSLSKESQISRPDNLQRDAL
jgi:1-acyl-sn-glycerol-3-phosphate acyltransferase